MLELRRHAERDPDRDALSAEGRRQAQEVGRGLVGGYALVFLSPAGRAAETVAWFLRARSEQLPPHDVVPGLAPKDPAEQTPERLGATLRELLALVPQGARALVVGHTPLLERGVSHLAGREIEPFAECEGVLIVQGDDGSLDFEELRLG